MSDIWLLLWFAVLIVVVVCCFSIAIFELVFDSDWWRTIVRRWKAD